MFSLAGESLSFKRVPNQSLVLWDSPVSCLHKIQTTSHCSPFHSVQPSILPQHLPLPLNVHYILITKWPGVEVLSAQLKLILICQTVLLQSIQFHQPFVSWHSYHFFQTYQTKLISLYSSIILPYYQHYFHNRSTLQTNSFL